MCPLVVLPPCDKDQETVMSPAPNCCGTFKCVDKETTTAAPEGTTDAPIIKTTDAPDPCSTVMCTREVQLPCGKDQQTVMDKEPNCCNRFTCVDKETTTAAPDNEDSTKPPIRIVIEPGDEKGNDAEDATVNAVGLASTVCAPVLSLLAAMTGAMML